MHSVLRMWSSLILRQMAHILLLAFKKVIFVEVNGRPDGLVLFRPRRDLNFCFTCNQLLT